VMLRLTGINMHAICHFLNKQTQAAPYGAVVLCILILDNFTPVVGLRMLA
jgi:hypothetical protein